MPLELFAEQTAASRKLRVYSTGKGDTMHRRVRIHWGALAATLALGAGAAGASHAQGNLQVFPQDKGGVNLTWLASPDPAVVGYNVYRRDSTLTSDKATLVNTAPLTTTTATDAGQPLGKPLTYFVKAVYMDAAGKASEGVSSGEVVVTPQNALALPAGNFLAYDLDTLNPSTVTMNGNVLTLQASGPPLWDRWDGQTFIATPVSGDYQITIRVEENPTNVDDNTGSNNAKAGVEIRSSLFKLDRYDAVFTSVNRDPSIQNEGRTTVTGGAVPFGNPSDLGQADTTYPLYLRLLKKGSVITAFQSVDGKTFNQVGNPQDYGSLPPTTYAGIFVSGDHTPDSDKNYTIGKFDTTQIKIEAQ
jgi:hypothetical protein